MSGAKYEKLLLLYEAIGELDERTATEALLYRHNAKIKSIRLAVVLVACICVLAATLIVGMNIALGGAKGEDPSDGNFADGAENVMTEGATQTQENGMSGDNPLTTPVLGIDDGTLEPDATQPEASVMGSIEALENLLRETQKSMIPVDDDVIAQILYNGRMSVLWKDSKGILYAIELDSDEKAEALKVSLTEKSAEITAQNDAPVYKIWVSFGDGRVVTPYLEYSEENIFDGTLFDYNPKVAPSDKFISELKKIIGI